MQISKILPFFALSLPIVLGLACGTPEAEQSSELRANIDVPTKGIEGIDLLSLQKVSRGVASFIRPGQSKVTIADLAKAIEVRPELAVYLPGIIAAHPNPIQVECKGRRCRGVSKGSAYRFLVDAIKIPLLGSPTVGLADKIEFELQVSSDERSFEVCKVLGISSQLGLVSGPLDGLAFDLSETKIERLVFDLGNGGSYPNNSCSF